MKGENCTLSVPRFGQRNVIAERVSHGLNVIPYAGEGESRNRRTLYTSKRSSGSFDLDLVFPSYEDYESTMKWLTRFGKWVSNPYGVPAAMRVTIPSRKFDKNGILEGGITFGDQVGSFVYRVNLAFMGASGAMDHTSEDSGDISWVDRKGDEKVARLYPSNSLIGGVDLVDRSLSPSMDPYGSSTSDWIPGALGNG